MRKTPIPSYVTKYFWGDDLTDLSLEKHENYIVQTVLNIGDIKAIQWLFSQKNKEVIKSMLPQLKLNPQSEKFWGLYLS